MTRYQATPRNANWQTACYGDSHLARQWHRAECAETLQDGPGRPEAVGVAS